MNLNQVAAQTYTIRDFTQTLEGIERSLRKLREIGYRAIQACSMGPIDPADLKHLCHEIGLTICAIHEPPEKILNNPVAVTEKLRLLDCKLVAYPYPEGIDLSVVEAVGTLITRLGQAGKTLAEAGFTLSYHHHHMEFRKVGGELILEKIARDTHPNHLSFEIDTYWVQYGGGDPVRWCAKLPGRLPAIHLKDYRITEDNEVDFAEIGAGTLDFKAVIAAAEASGCQWFIVEQDTCPGDPFDSLAQSFNYIRDNLCA